MVPSRPFPGAGGALDLASGAGRLIITMSHTDKRGAAKLVRRCDLPLTATGVVDVLISELAVFRFVDRRMKLVKLMPGVPESPVAAATEAEYDRDLA